MKRFLSRVKEPIAQIVNGCLIYYGGVAVYDGLAKGRSAFIPALSLILFITLAFSLSTIYWMKRTLTKPEIPPPELYLLIGLFVFFPFYFALLPPLFPEAEESPIIRNLNLGARTD